MIYADSNNIKNYQRRQYKMRLEQLNGINFNIILGTQKYLGI